MSFEQLMGQADAMVRQAQAVSALAARLRLRELGVAGDAAVNAELDHVAEALDARGAQDELSPEQSAILAGFVRAYLRQAVDLLEYPAREGAWTNDDPATLQAQGQASAAVASLFQAAELGDAGVRVLDVGTGVARLAIAFCRTYSDSTVVGVDPFEPALALARENIANEGLESRITLVPSTIQELDDSEGFDLVWFPTFFIPEAVIDQALTRIKSMTRPGAEVVLGVFEAPDDPLAAAVDAVFTVRSGGAVLTIDDADSRLRQAGFADVRAISTPPGVPLQLVVGIAS